MTWRLEHFVDGVHECARTVRRRCFPWATAMKSSTKTSMNAAGLVRRLCVGRSRGSDSTRWSPRVRHHRVVAGQGAYAFALASAGGASAGIGDGRSLTPRLQIVSGIGPYGRRPCRLVSRRRMEGPSRIGGRSLWKDGVG
jgi:hypothetical protein